MELTYNASSFKFDIKPLQIYTTCSKIYIFSFKIYITICSAVSLSKKEPVADSSLRDSALSGRGRMLRQHTVVFAGSVFGVNGEGCQPAGLA